MFLCVFVKVRKYGGEEDRGDLTHYLIPPRRNKTNLNKMTNCL